MKNKKPTIKPLLQVGQQVQIMPPRFGAINHIAVKPSGAIMYRVDSKWYYRHELKLVTK